MATQFRIETILRIIPEKLPCPFCSNANDYLLSVCDNGDEACVDCDNCGASGPWIEVMQEDKTGESLSGEELRHACAIIAWNRAPRRETKPEPEETTP